MTPIACQECGRANGASAKKCIWCGVPLQGADPSRSFESTRVELGYLDGLDRLHDPVPVRFTIGMNGVEVTELMPGSRSIAIPASAIIGASVVDASTMTPGKRVRSTWWWLAIGPLAAAIPGKRQPDVKLHDYILTIRYKQGAETCNAVFHREDSVGLSIIEGLARIVGMLVRRNAANAPTESPTPRKTNY